MKKWEYATWFEALTDIKAKNELLRMMPNAFGREGWELVSVTNWPAGAGTGVAGLLYYFKRPLPESFLEWIVSFSKDIFGLSKLANEQPFREIGSTSINP